MAAIKPTVYLIKDSITEPKHIFKKGYKLTSTSKEGITLYYKTSRKTTPEWADYLAENFEISTKPFKNSSSYAVLVVEVENRLFALPLGMGIHMLDLTKTEYNFGLRTTINCIEKAEIRQLDTTTPEVNSQKTKKQAVTGTTPEEFGINKQKDILRGIIGKLPKNHKLGDALEGKDSLRLTSSFEGLSKIKGLCKRILKLYMSESYKKEYPWIDNIALVRDRSLTDLLTKQLARALRKADFSNMYFLPPLYYDELVEFEGFVFSTGDRSRLSKKDKFELPDMKEWKRSVGVSIKEMSFETIDDFKVNVLRDSGRYLGWPLQRCLSWETELDGNKYVLSEGNWYRVSESFFKSVEDYYRERVMDSHDLPTPSLRKLKESAYNKEISDAENGRYLFDLGHEDSKTYSISKDRNEICDVFDTTKKIFYHVKMGKTSSALSHLFRQGSFSGEILKRDPESRKEFRKHLEKQGCDPKIISEPYLPQHFKIVFVVVLGKTQKKDIPFFSKVSFREVAEKNLEYIGHECQIAFVTMP